MANNNNKYDENGLRIRHNKHIKTYENEQYVKNNAWSTPRNILANKLGISVPTLNKYYSEEMKQSEGNILDKATQAFEMLIEQGEYKAIDKIISKLGRLKDTDNSNNISISLNTYVDKPQDKTLEQWLETYSHKPQEIETIEPELIKE